MARSQSVVEHQNPENCPSFNRSYSRQQQVASRRWKGEESTQCELFLQELLHLTLKGRIRIVWILFDRINVVDIEVDKRRMVKICDDQSDEIRSPLFTGLHATPEMAGITFNVLIKRRDEPFPLEELVEWKGSNENGNMHCCYLSQTYDGPCIIHNCDNRVHRSIKKCQIVYGKLESSDVYSNSYQILTPLVGKVEDKGIYSYKLRSSAITSTEHLTHVR